MTAPSILDALDDPGLFGEAFAEPTWRPWRAFLGVLFGLPLPDDLAQSARTCTGRTDALTAGPYREAWLVVGRRSGKSRVLGAGRGLSRRVHALALAPSQPLLVLIHTIHPMLRRSSRPLLKTSR